jgi:protein TonB
MPSTDVPALAGFDPTCADPRAGVSLRFVIGLGASLVLHGLLFGLLLHQADGSGAPPAPPASTLLVEWQAAAPTPPAPPAPPARRASSSPGADAVPSAPIPAAEVDEVDAASVGAALVAIAAPSGDADAPQELESADVPASAPVPSATDAYLWDVLAHLRRFQRYPERARRDGIEGTVWLRARVSRQGEVLRAEIERSSGHDPLDAAAARLIARASPLPPPPPGAFAITDLQLPVEYRLQRE